MHTHNGSKYGRSKTIVYYVYYTKNTIKTQLIYFKKKRNSFFMSLILTIILVRLFDFRIFPKSLQCLKVLDIKKKVKLIYNENNFFFKYENGSQG